MRGANRESRMRSPRMITAYAATRWRFGSRPMWPECMTGHPRGGAGAARVAISAHFATVDRMRRDPWLDNAKFTLVTLVVTGHPFALLGARPLDLQFSDFISFWPLPDQPEEPRG